MFESTAYAMAQSSQAQGQAAPSPFAHLFFMFGIIAIFYFLIWRPQQQKQKDHDKKVSELKKNDDIITNGGIHGTIVNIKDKTFVVRIADNVKIEISRSAVAGIKKKQGDE